MPYKEKVVEKLYYSIGEVASILNESTSLVRFWADKFNEFIKPTRTKKGNRMFSAQDLSNFKMIYFLVKESGMTLDGAAKRMKEGKVKGEDDVNSQVIIKLVSIKEKLLEIREYLTDRQENLKEIEKIAEQEIERAY